MTRHLAFQAGFAWVAFELRMALICIKMAEIEALAQYSCVKAIFDASISNRLIRQREHTGVFASQAVVACYGYHHNMWS
jgi:hypothetical protein